MKLLKNLKENKNLIYVFFFSAVCFSAAHMFGVLNPTIAHDSMSEFNLLNVVDYAQTQGYILKIRAGRFTEVIYQFILRGYLANPWLVGCFSFTWLLLFSIIVIDLLDINNPVLIFLVSAVICTNNTVTATFASYMHDVDVNLFGIFLAGLSVWLCYKKNKGFLVGIIPIVFCLGCYQSCYCVAISLAIIKSIKDFLDKKVI